MPLLDVTEVLLDPMFQDTSLVARRETETVGLNGMAVFTPTTFSFAGVVVQASGEQLQRLENGTRHADSIDIYTLENLIDGQQGLTADVVIWQGNEYTVAKVLDWSTYGRGFKHVICDLRNLIPS